MTSLTLEELQAAIEQQKEISAECRDHLDELLLKAEEIEKQIDLAIAAVDESRREQWRLRQQKNRLGKK